MILYDYDDASVESILEYSKNLENMTFNDVRTLARIHNLEVSEEGVDYGKTSNKGGLGNLIEKDYFGYEPNSNQEADFPKVGMELKVTPVELKKGNKWSAGERLVLTMIEYDKEIEEDFYKSHVWAKMKKILMIHYWRDKSIKNKLDYKILNSNVIELEEEDLKIIREDFKIIVNKVKSGNAHMLSESDTMYLGACTKGATAEKSTVKQFYNKEIPAKKRAFSLKVSFMTYLYDKYVLNKKIKDESIFKKPRLESETTEDYILRCTNMYVGKTDIEIARELGFDFNKMKSKDKHALLTLRMLGVKSNLAHELVLANIKTKSIRIEENGKIKEHMSLPPFKMKEFANEQEWEDSQLYEMLDATRYLFSVYSKDMSGRYIFKGSMLWSMPQNDIDIVEREWKQNQMIVQNGIDFNVIKQINGEVVKNNLVNASKSEIVHIRPHASRSFHIINNIEYGNGNITDADELPNGDWMTKQSFWLNKEYVLKVIKNYFEN